MKVTITVYHSASIVLNYECKIQSSKSHVTHATRLYGKVNTLTFVLLMERRGCKSTHQTTVSLPFHNHLELLQTL